MNDWEYSEDPYRIIPVGFKSRHGRVVSFSAPAGISIKYLVIVIESGTTIGYLTILKEYIAAVEAGTVVAPRITS